MEPESDGNKATTEVAQEAASNEAGQTGPQAGTEVASPEAAGAQDSSGWKVGDSVYRTPEELVEAFKKLHGAYTQRSQEYSKLKAESQAGMELLALVREDPALLAEVKKRISRGQSPQEAVAGSISEHPEVRKMADKLDSIERQLAQERFEAEHEDLDEKDLQAIADFISENAEWLDRSGLSYDRMLEIAYNSVFRSKMAPRLLEQGQKIAEQAIVKGQQKSGLRTVASTAGVSQPSKPYSKMTPLERRDFAMRLYKSFGKKA